MLSLFFVSQIGAEPEIVVMGDEAHHAIKVTRLRLGDELMLSDGDGNWAKAQVARIAKDSFVASVIEIGTTALSNPKLIVIQALPKSERVKEAIELLTQAGADEIIPWEAERSISQWKSDLANKWLKTAFAASKQSRRFRIPSIAAPFNFSTLSSKMTPNSFLIVFHETADEKLSKVFGSKFNESIENIYIVVGPEGGLSNSEIEKFKLAGGVVAHLGEPVFRSAHAGVAALSAIQALLGRW